MLAPLISSLKDRTIRNVIMVFMLMGMVIGNWVAFIPFLKNAHDLDEAQMGLLLLCMPFGAILMNPISVSLMHRFGDVNITLFFHAISAVGFLAAFALPNPYLAGVALFLAGMCYSAVNMSINTCASTIEAHYKRHIMASCHGFWSLGAMIGSLMAAASIAIGFGPLTQFTILCAILLVGTWIVNKPIRKISHFEEHHDREKPKLKWPNKVLWILIIIGLCASLLEGTMADWSTIYMRDVLLANASVASFGFAAYAFFMASGRFLGDYMQEKYGSMFMLKICAGVSIIGMIMIITAGSVISAIVGCAMVGAGVSLASPILYATSAKVPGYGKGVGLATMNSFAMFGFLGGPAIIGFIAKATSLSTSFIFVCGMCCLWLVMSFWTEKD